MPTLNVWLEIYGKKTCIIYLKLQIFLFFSEPLSMSNQIAHKNIDNSGT